MSVKKKGVKPRGQTAIAIRYFEKPLTFQQVSEHGLGLYYRPKEGCDADCEVPTWIKEGWQWMLNRALGFRSQKPKWFHLPVTKLWYRFPEQDESK